jgi:hypothetical protein
VTGGVDQVDQEVVLLDLDGDILQVLLIVELGVQGNGGGLDGHTTLLLVGSGIRETGLTSFRRRDNTGTLNEGVGKGGFSVVDCGQNAALAISSSSAHTGFISEVLTVGNDGHVTDVRRVVHETTDLAMQSVLRPC